MKHESPYHNGELSAQALAGVSEQANMIARVILDYIRDDALPFIAKQSKAILGFQDIKGKLWASIIFGNPGFVSAKDRQTLCLDLRNCYSGDSDPMWQQMEKSQRLGMLLIDLESRKRLRINGQVLAKSESEILIHVDQSYGNCPKYIQSRRLQIQPLDSRYTDFSHEGKQLSSELKSWIRRMDTFFVASAHPTHGLDVSHRGGFPGFVNVLSSSRLRIPDFSGNNMFNTLGNFLSFPNAGLTFLDFDSGKVLQLTGKPSILWNAPDLAGEGRGATRFWEFEIEKWQTSSIPVKTSWQYLGASPYLPTS